MSTSAELKAALNDTQLQVLELLGKGVPANIVASTLDISPSYVTQCTEHPVFKQELQSMLLVSQLAASQRDEELDSLEDLLIEQVKKTAIYITKPMEAMKALQMVNGMKRRGLGGSEGAASITNNNTVILNIPQHVRPTVHTVVSDENEVVEVDGRHMITKSSQAVLAQLDAHKEKKAESRINEKVGSVVGNRAAEAATDGSDF